ncbi:MAG: hypothetical protein A3H31_03195 [Gallionellales bacterium RIFCSPLOWO2_02_FULL_57_47]|nr:MAG: hypothetical protein A3H31_03195 [Gallionellales bacterium RIFCSPLOWO2_02_FULL_57_47]
MIFLVEEQPNPSTDFFVLPAVVHTGLRVVRCGFADLPAPADLEGAAVVFVRYVPSAWARLIDAVRPRLHSLAYFMDDDLLDVDASAGMSWRYRFKLARLAAWRRGWLRRQASELWVSSGYLQQKYADWHPKLVLPSCLANPADVRRMYYHGTASHGVEIRWLRPVMEEALRRDDRLVLEIVGGRDVYRLYRGVPRVTVVHPMKWPAYQSFLALPGRHIGLAPLLDVPFNLGRSYTKFFDITRCGAVGIYSPGSIYSEVVSHGENGLIVELEQEAWVTAILEIARDEPLRQSLLRNAEVKSAELAGLAHRGYSGLINKQPE